MAARIQRRVLEFQLDIQKVCLAAKALEVGPDFGQEELQGWHGSIDTSIVLQAKDDFWKIKWRKVTLTHEPDPVTIWITMALLHELDQIPLYHRSDDVKIRARDFSRWLSKQIEKPQDIQEVPMGDGVRLKFWTAPLTDVPPDSQHLEAALGLRDRKVPVVVVTHDNHLKVRAFAEGLQVVDLPDDMLK